MRDRMERFVILPFSVGCVSESSVAVAVQPQHQQQHQHPRRSKPVENSSNSSTATIGEEEEEESMKYSLKFLPLPKPDISNGFNRLFKSFKTLSQYFAYKEEMEESEEEMEIGVPTDVKHVTHIGLDGSTTSNISPGNNWDNLVHELFTFRAVPNPNPNLIPTPPGQCELPIQTPQPTASSPLVQAST